MQDLVDDVLVLVAGGCGGGEDLAQLGRAAVAAGDEVAGLDLPAVERLVDAAAHARVGQSRREVDERPRRGRHRNPRAHHPLDVLRPVRPDALVRARVPRSDLRIAPVPLEPAVEHGGREVRQHGAGPAGQDRRQELTLDRQVRDDAVDAAVLREEAPVRHPARHLVGGQTTAAQILYAEHTPLLGGEQSTANVNFVPLSGMNLALGGHNGSFTAAAATRQDADVTTLRRECAETAPSPARRP